MDARENLGEYGYVILNNRIAKGQIQEVIVTTNLNTCSPDHGKWLPEKVSYNLEDIGRFTSDNVFLNKEDIIKNL